MPERMMSRLLLSSSDRGEEIKKNTLILEQKKNTNWPLFIYNLKCTELIKVVYIWVVAIFFLMKN